MIAATDLRIGNLFNGIGMVQTVKEIIDYSPNGYLFTLLKELRGQEPPADDPTPGYEHLILCVENGNQYKPVEISGIPLDRAILVLMGAKNGRWWPNQYHWTDEPSDLKVLFSMDEGKTDPDWTVSIPSYCDDYYHGEINRKVKYVHEMQNLYYMLTGKEMEMKKEWVIYSTSKPTQTQFYGTIPSSDTSESV